MYWDHCSLEVLLRCAEIGTIWLCFRTSVCSSRALRMNQTGNWTTGQLMQAGMLAGCCALWKKKRQKNSFVLTCGHQAYPAFQCQCKKLSSNHLLRHEPAASTFASAASIFASGAASVAEPQSCWSSTAKGNQSTNTGKRTVISWIARETFMYQGHLFSEVAGQCKPSITIHIYKYTSIKVYKSSMFKVDKTYRNTRAFTLHALPLVALWLKHHTKCTALVGGKPNDDC